MSVQEIVVRAVVTRLQEHYGKGVDVLSLDAQEMESSQTMSNLPAAGLNLQIGDEIEVVVRKMNESRRPSLPQ